MVWLFKEVSFKAGIHIYIVIVTLLLAELVQTLPEDHPLSRLCGNVTDHAFKLLFVGHDICVLRLDEGLIVPDGFVLLTLSL